MGNKSKFKEWVDIVGIETVMAVCGVGRRTVYNWLAGTTKPSRERCKTILAIAKNLTMDDVVGGAR